MGDCNCMYHEIKRLEYANQAKDEQIERLKSINKNLADLIELFEKMSPEVAAYLHAPGRMLINPK